MSSPKKLTSKGTWRHVSEAPSPPRFFWGGKEFCRFGNFDETHSVLLLYMLSNGEGVWEVNWKEGRWALVYKRRRKNQHD